MTTDDSKAKENTNNNSCSMPQDDQKVIWKDFLKRDSSLQCTLFLNLYWSELQSEKEDIISIYKQYIIREEAVPTVAFSPFNMILENLQKENVKRVCTAMDTYGDRPSMAKRFLVLGFKMNNSRISLLEALLFIYGLTVEQTVTRAPTACEGQLRGAKSDLQAVRDRHKARADAIAKLKADIESGAIKKMKVAGVRMQITQMENDLTRDGVQMKREVRNARKVVASAESALAAETSAGTDASNYFSAQTE